jgi:hypothetical protein
MANIINQVDNSTTGTPELWITIKDASDLLGVSERHAWRISTDNAFKTQKMINQDRKKTYVLRADVEKFAHAERERQRLDKIKSSPISDKYDIHDMPDIKGENDMSDIKSGDVRHHPVLMSDSRNTFLEMHKQQMELIKREAVWRTAAIAITASSLTICAIAGVLIYDSRKAMSDIKTEMSDIRKTMSDKERAMSDIINKAQTEAASIKDTLFQRELYINRIEQILPKEKLDEIKTKERSYDEEHGL